MTSVSPFALEISFTLDPFSPDRKDKTALLRSVSTISLNSESSKVPATLVFSWFQNPCLETTTSLVVDNVFFPFALEISFRLDPFSPDRKDKTAL